MFLRRGVPTGTGGTSFCGYFPGRSVSSFLCIPGDAQGGSVRVSLSMGFLCLLSSEEDSALRKVPSIRMILLFESLPGKGNEGRWIAQRNPFHTAERPGTFRPWRGGSQVPSVRPDGFPEGKPPGFLGGALEVWYPIRFLSPKGWDPSWSPGLRGSGPHGDTCLPFCRGNGEPWLR